MNDAFNLCLIYLCLQKSEYGTVNCSLCQQEKTTALKRSRCSFFGVNDKDCRRFTDYIRRVEEQFGLGDVFVEQDIERRWTSKDKDDEYVIHINSDNEENNF